MSSGRVIIVGGGVIGVCCAYYLVTRGADVMLLERDEIGAGASRGNAGVIAAGHPPMNKPGRVAQAIRKMLDPTTSLYIAPRWDPALAKWLWAFSANCTFERLEENMSILSPLGHATLGLFRELIDVEQLDCGYRAEGYHEVCRTRAGVELSHHEVSLMQAQAYRAETLSGDELRARMPALKDGTMGGAYFPAAATCNPYQFVVEMADRVRRYGGRVQLGQPVTDLVTEQGQATGVRTGRGDVLEADAVVLATGAYSLELTRKLGCRLPVQPGKGYHRDLEVADGSAPALGEACVLGETSVFCTPMGGSLRLAGTMEFSGLNHVMRRSRLEQLTSAAGRYMDGIGTTGIRSEWCGLRPCTPDGLPIIGLVPGQQRVFLATGHAMSGLTLGPITGSLIADLVMGETLAADVRRLEAARFG